MTASANKIELPDKMLALIGANMTMEGVRKTMEYFQHNIAPILGVIVVVCQAFIGAYTVYHIVSGLIKGKKAKKDPTNED